MANSSLIFFLGWKQFISFWKSGESKVLILSIIVAVAATTSVGFFSQRLQSSLDRQGNFLLGADLVLNSDHVLPEPYRHEAIEDNNDAVETMEFPSMVIAGTRSRLAEVKAIEPGFPLRGYLTISHQQTVAGFRAGGVPDVSTVWMEPRLANELGIRIGDTIQLGDHAFQLAAFLVSEPSRGGDLFNIAPRIMLNSKDVPLTHLIQFGSRVKYQLLVAGSKESLQRFLVRIKPQLLRGERIEDLTSSRPEMRSLLNKAGQFLGLASVGSVILSILAMILATIPFVQKGRQTFALMRCFGASRELITGILIFQGFLVASMGSIVGIMLGFVVQGSLVSITNHLLVDSIAPPNLNPLFEGLGVGFITLMAVLLPHLFGLANVPPLLILRNNVSQGAQSNWRNYLPVALLIVCLVFWHSENTRLALAMIFAIIGLILLISIFVLLFKKFFLKLFQDDDRLWKFGIKWLDRRFLLSLAQIISISLGLMSLLLLGIVRDDLLQNWKASLPADAPNRFVINIQQGQKNDLSKFFSESRLPDVKILPMVRGRLTSVNGIPIDLQKYKDERARRLVEREFNLSWAEHLQNDNQIVAGNWWTAQSYAKPLVSLEEGLAKTLELKVGDTLTFDVGGNQLDLKVENLRKVEWDSMHVNFFALTPPGILDSYETSYITSFHLPSGQDETITRLNKAFPNLTIIDVSSLLDQVQALLEKLTRVLGYVFLFSLVSGMMVLYSSMIAVRDERIREVALFRLLGASKMQVIKVMVIEYLAIGILSSLTALVLANLLAWYVCEFILKINYRLDFLLSFFVMASCILLVPLSAWMVVRRFLDVPPKWLIQNS